VERSAYQILELSVGDTRGVFRPELDGRFAHTLIVLPLRPAQAGATTAGRLIWRATSGDLVPADQYDVAVLQDIAISQPAQLHNRIVTGTSDKPGRQEVLVADPARALGSYVTPRSRS
jgi:hypothetical protein